MKIKKKKAKTPLTFTKKIVLLVLIVALIDMQIPFVLSFLGREPVETLGTTIVIEIVGVCIGYFVKAFFGKKEEEKLKFERERMETDDGPDEDI